MLRQIRAHRLARELEVSLVHHHERIGGVEQPEDERLAGKLPRGVVRAGHHQVVDTALGDARQHGLLVDGEVGAARHVHHRRVREAGVRVVHRERGRQVEERAPRPAPRQRQVEQELVAPVAHQHLVAVEPVRFGDHVAQVVGQRVRVAVEGQALHLAHDVAADLVVDVVRVLVRREDGGDGQILRIVGHHARQLGRGRAHATHRHPRLRPRGPLRRRPRSHTRCPCRAGSCASPRSWRAPTGPRGARWWLPCRHRGRAPATNTG